MRIRLFFPPLGCLALLVLTPPLQSQTLLERLERRLSDAIAPARNSDPQKTGVESQSPGYLGLRGDDRGENGRGVRILEVHEGSPAAVAGLKKNDLIRSINGQPIRDLEAMISLMQSASPGEQLRFTIERNNRQQTFPVTLGAIIRDDNDGSVVEGEPELLPEPHVPPPPEPGMRPSLGVSVVPLSVELRNRYSVPIREGAVINRVTAGSPAEKTGLPIGGVIVSANGEQIEEPADLVDVIRRAPTDRPIEITYYHGNRYIRTSVQLTETGPPDVAPTQPELQIEPPTRGPPLATDRPVLRRLEKVIDGLIESPEVAANERRRHEDLQQQVSDLKRQVEELTQRLNELEQRLARQRN